MKFQSIVIIFVEVNNVGRVVLVELYQIKRDISLYMNLFMHIMYEVNAIKYKITQCKNN